MNEYEQRSSGDGDRRQRRHDRDDDPGRFDLQEEIRRQRLESIREARLNVRDERMHSRKLVEAGHVDLNRANERLHEALGGFLTELRPHRKLAPEYWNGEHRDRPIGKLVVEPPKDFDSTSDRWQQYTEGFGIDSSRTNMEPITLRVFDGLDDLHDHKTRYEHTWYKYVNPRNMPPKVYYSPRQYAVQRHILLGGVEWAVQFANEIGLDLQPSQENEWEI